MSITKFKVGDKLLWNKDTMIYTVTEVGGDFYTLTWVRDYYNYVHHSDIDMTEKYARLIDTDNEEEIL